MPTKNPKLDKSHHAFKRARKLGPGPREGALAQTRDWECKKVAPFGAKKDKKKYYFQLCVYVGDDDKKLGKKKKVKIGKEYKAEYNAEYAKHLKKRGKPRFANTYNTNYNPRTGRAKRK